MGPPAQLCRRAWGLPNPPPSVPRGGPELQTAEAMTAPMSPPSAGSALHGTPSPESLSDFCPRPLGDTASVPPSFECFRLYSTSLRLTGSLPDSGRHSVVAARLALQTARRLRAREPGPLQPQSIQGEWARATLGAVQRLPNASVRGARPKRVLGWGSEVLSAGRQRGSIRSPPPGPSLAPAQVGPACPGGGSPWGLRARERTGGTDWTSVGGGGTTPTAEASGLCPAVSRTEGAPGEGRPHLPQV